MKKIMVCLCAACGAGKSTLLDYLRDNAASDSFCFVDTDGTGLNWWDYADTENPERCFGAVNDLTGQNFPYAIDKL